MACRHWQVISPEITEYSEWEPPETYRCWDSFEVDSARQAVILAVKSEVFRPWVEEARGDGHPPFRGLEVSRCVCEHGVCWECEVECDQCVAEDKREWM